MEGAGDVQDRPGAAGMRLVAPPAPRVTANPICGDTSVGCSHWHVPTHGGHTRHGGPGCCLELCEGFKDKYGPSLCLSLCPEDGFHPGFHIPSFFCWVLAPWGPPGCLAWCSQDIAVPTCPSPHGFWLRQGWWGHKDVSWAVVTQGERWAPSTGITGRSGLTHQLLRGGRICWEAAAFSAVENPIKLLLNSFALLFFFFPCP